ncbi:hypothetical protein FE257_007814 [Aspergillus nanangensis]|uniref:Carrier domain-containing protein n=1 Tax=Aspergillus nanangensis TaxID=2582783 RepID=A0AAD4GYV2_ASPNN|nr:hypothetical protein FE257_007814 [Aspergillus nanangensis]
MESSQKRLLATTVDDRAKTNPHQLFAVIPKGPELSHGFQDLSIDDLARAVDFLCWWIERTIGPAQSPETLAYLGNNDARYFIFMLACQKTGYQAFLPSTRNSDEAHVHLLKATNCTKFFFSEERKTRALEIEALFPGLNVFQVPAEKIILGDKSPRLHYTYTKTYADAENDTICIIHSSGTTGMPKPVYLTNGFFMTLDASSYLPTPAGRQPAIYHNLGQKDLMLALTPFFHLMGLMPLIFSVWFKIPALISPDKALSVGHMVKLLRTARPTAAICPPSLLDDMSNSDEALSCLQELKSVYLGGAPLSPETGERLRKFTQVITVIGASEIGWIPALVPEDPANWGYFEWSEAYGVDMQDTGEGMFEMVIPRQHNARDFKGIFHTYSNIEVYSTNDIYTQHPKNPDLWKFYGRKDDVIVLSNGEKFNPVGMETIIEGHPLVGRAVVVGQSRFQAGLLVEPSHDVAEGGIKVFVNEIWPAVTTANQTVAAHGRIMKSKIGLAVKAKPFKRTPKGTVQRRAVLRDYEAEIDAIYTEDIEDDLVPCLPETLDQESVTKYIQQIIVRLLGKTDFSITQDFYSAGLDSLMTIQISRLLQKSIQLRRPDIKPGAINPQTIYGHPTIARLSLVVTAILAGNASAEIPRAQKLQDLVDKYTSDLPARSPQPLPTGSHTPPSTVILTGSTGSLGTYLLHSLLSTPTISKIYCLNRSSDAPTRQQTSFREKSLPLTDWQTRIEFLQASLGDPHFGLTKAKYQSLLDSVDTIIHNAWKVDFNHSVDSFEHTHIQGVRRFVDFSLASRHSAHLHFISSVGTVGGWTPDMGPSVPEVPMGDSAAVLPQGYGESKHVAERICYEASRRSHVPTSVYRVGQIAGPTSEAGLWNPHEWLPTIVATSKSMGIIPLRLGEMVVDWVPVDTLSTIISEIIHTRHTTAHDIPNAVLHLTNPEPISWSSLIPEIQSHYAVQPVEFSAWVAELEKITTPSSADLASKPALKLLDFYRGLQEEGSALSVALDVRRAKEASASMRTLGPVSAQLMGNWLRQWGF